MIKIRQQGFSLLELVIALALIIVLATSSYTRYMGLVVDAERAAFRGVWGWLRSGINMEMSEALSSRGFESLTELEHTNPMILVMKVMESPSNYLGELSQQEVHQAAPGSWYYDLDQRLLVYHVRYTENIEGIEGDADKRLKFKLKVVRRNADSLSDKEQYPVRGLELSPVDKNFWQTPLSFGKNLN